MSVVVRVAPRPLELVLSLFLEPFSLRVLVAPLPPLVAPEALLQFPTIVPQVAALGVVSPQVTPHQTVVLALDLTMVRALVPTRAV